MKKAVTLATLLLVSVSALAVYHNWRKIGETEDKYTSAKVCTWECRGSDHGGEHHTVTKGHGVCPRPK